MPNQMKLMIARSLCNPKHKIVVTGGGERAIKDVTIGM
jgi:hypothetical protein